MIEPKEMAQMIAETLSAKKAMDVIIIDISPKSSFADYFVMASAGNERQLEAFKDHVEDLLEPMEIFPKSVEGKRDSGWILMDYGDVIVNMLTLDMREKYNIEKIWGDCEFVTVE
ncbi:MAG: ribosome silencing factor [Firmicutes bacterium]|nr:ribosome silencing factor [Bacillota bacterium]